MSNVNSRVPKPSKHRGSGQAVVRLNGHDFYVGPHGTPAAEAEYETLIARWLSNGRQLPRPEVGMTIVELILAYDCHAETYYLKNGARTSEYQVIRQLIGFFCQHGEAVSTVREELTSSCGD